MSKTDYSGLFRRLEREKSFLPGKAAIIKTLKEEGRLLAVKGSMDHVERVLPHCYAAEKTIVGPHARVPDLGKYTGVLIACPGRLTKDWHQAIKEYVAAGGFLVTTDWTLRLLERVFPGNVSYAGRAHGSYPVRFRNLSHPFLHGVKEKGIGSWDLESSSYLVSIDDPKAVEVHMEAEGVDPSPIMMSFRHGRGSVVHFVSHFHLQESHDSTRYVSAFLLTNIIEEAMKARYPDHTAGRVRLASAAPLSARPSGRVRLLDERRPPRVRVLKE